MSKERFKKDQIVKIIDGSEYPMANVEGEIGVVLGTIPPDSNNPHRVMVSLDGKGLINILPGDLKKVRQKSSRARVSSRAPKRPSSP